MWADDNKTFFYIENDPETLLSKRVRKHVVGTDPKADPVVYEEADDTFYMGIGRTRDDAFIVIALDSTGVNETRYAPASDPAQFKVLAPRELDVEYDADHHGGRWVIRTNADGATNFKLVTAADGSASPGTGRTGSRRDRGVHRGHQAVRRLRRHRRALGRPGARAHPQGQCLRLREGRRDRAYSMGLDVNASRPPTGCATATPRWRCRRPPTNSTSGPASAASSNANRCPATTGRLRDRTPVGDRRDGTKGPGVDRVPQGLRKNGKAALLQYGYGSYGASMDRASRSPR